MSSQLIDQVQVAEQASCQNDDFGLGRPDAFEAVSDANDHIVEPISYSLGADIETCLGPAACLLEILSILGAGNLDSSWPFILKAISLEGLELSRNGGIERRLRDAELAVDWSAISF